MTATPKPPETITPRLLTVEGAARYLGRKVSSMRSLIASGAVQVVKAPGERRLYLDRFDLDRFTERFKMRVGE